MRSLKIVLCACFGYFLIKASSPGLLYAAVNKSSPSIPHERVYPQGVTTVIEDVSKIFTILGIVIGGTWVYYNTFRGRTYRQRLELEISSRAVERQDLIYIHARAVLKNVGLSRVPLKREGTVFIISQHSHTLEAPCRVFNWRDISITRVFDKHKWIEPGEVIPDDVLVAAKREDGLLISCKVRVVSEGHPRTEWNASCMTICYEDAPFKD
jgi:hypothetical protein